MNQFTITQKARRYWRLSHDCHATWTIGNHV